ncbi:MAG: M48 family metalloprotease [Hyphomicrobiales bacterium]|nr:M48 family metalloprotease [Rickettsiales bacterium]MCP5361240.1 M48 family metalloprotease [Hyphomicrobiales bacterium]
MKFLTLLLALIVSLQASMAQAISLIRDAETEGYLNAITTPVFRAAGLKPENVHLYLVNDPELNAYVAGGMNIFIHTGLLTFSEDPSVLIGVLAHEAGHIEGGHLIRMQQEMENVQMGAVLSTLLGLASAAAGAPAAGQAILSGGSHVAERTALKFSRTHEESADQAAIRILKHIGITPKGLLTLLEALSSRQEMLYGKLNPYTLTHPLSKERISHIRSQIVQDPALDKAISPALEAQHQRVFAKVFAFLQPPETTLAKYPPSDTSFAARYARAVAWHKQAQLVPALKEMDGLLAHYPGDAYLHELKGQILYEHGRIDEAVASYRQAVALRPETLIRLGYALALLAKTPGATTEAIAQLQKILITEPENTMAWHQLGIAYGRADQLGQSYLALAEEAMRLKNKDDVEKYLGMVEQHEAEGSPARLRAEDIRQVLKKQD